jgi:hypothetical protein
MAAMPVSDSRVTATAATATSGCRREVGVVVVMLSSRMM